MHARKLILTALLGGPIVGALTGVAIDPTMSPAPEPSWRKLVENTYVPKPIAQIVEVGPQDLSPLYTTMRDRILARRYLDAAAHRRDASYGYAAVAADPPRGLTTYPGVEGDTAAAAADADAAVRDAALPAAPPEDRAAVIVVEPQPGEQPELPLPGDAAPA